MKKKQIIGDKVTFSINTDEPINVKDLVDGLVAFSNEYVSSAKLKDTAVQITEVRKGCKLPYFLRQSKLSISTILI